MVRVRHATVRACPCLFREQKLVPVPLHFVQVAFKLPDWMESLSWIYPLVSNSPIELP